MEPDTSLPTRERELKLLPLLGVFLHAASLPTRERELKHGEGLEGVVPRPVAPYTGA